MCAPLCDEVVGREGSTEMLEHLERTNTFLVPLDGKRRWFRYHHLFGELLRHELDRTAPEEAAELRARAGRWLARHGFHTEGIDQLMAAGRHEEAAELVTALWLACTSEGQLSTVERWLDELPPRVVESDARLCMIAVWIALSLGRSEPADRWLRAAEAAPGTVGTWPGAPDIETEIAIGRVIHAAITGNSTAAREAAVGIDLAATPPASPSRSLAGLAVGVQQAQDARYPEAIEAFADAAEAGVAAGTHIPALVCLAFLANLAAERGDLVEAERRAREAIELAAIERHLEFPHAAGAHVALARVEVDRGRPERAREHVTRAITLAERAPETGSKIWSEAAIAEVLLDLGEIEAGREAAERVRQAIEAAPDPGMRAHELARRVENRLRGEPATAPARSTAAEPADLTEREVQVLRLLTGLLSAREIADNLYVSHNTVKTQIRSIYRKLGVGSRAEAVARGRELGVI
jgi:LuxR family maltose regulon positive regulatory protein